MSLEQIVSCERPPAVADEWLLFGIFAPSVSSVDLSPPTSCFCSAYEYECDAAGAPTSQSIVGNVDIDVASRAREWYRPSWCGDGGGEEKSWRKLETRACVSLHVLAPAPIMTKQVIREMWRRWASPESTIEV